MLNRNALRVELLMKDRTLAWLAGKLHLSRTTIYRKMKGQVPFTIEDAELICELLDITDPVKKCAIFFAPSVLKVGQKTAQTDEP